MGEYARDGGTGRSREGPVPGYLYEAYGSGGRKTLAGCEESGRKREALFERK